MTARDWLEWIPTIITIVVAVGVFVGKNWLKARIERSVQHTFDQEIEKVRTELRASEERLKSDLRIKETEISALRDGVLSGRAQRQALLDQRRLEAVERVWTRVSSGLVNYKTLATIMDSWKLDEPLEPSRIKVLEELLSSIPEDDMRTGNMKSEQMFISPPAWAYFSAYQTVLSFSYARARAIVSGLPRLRLDPRNLLKFALPDRDDLIDKSPASVLDELEESILKELMVMLEGHEYDKAEVSHATDIIRLVSKANTDFQLSTSGA